MWLMKNHKNLNSQENKAINRCQLQDDIEVKIIKDFKAAIIFTWEEIRANILVTNGKTNTLKKGKKDIKNKNKKFKYKNIITKVNYLGVDSIVELWWQRNKTANLKIG